MKKGSLSIGLMLLILFISLPAQAAAAKATPNGSALVGKLSMGEGQGPVLKTGAKEYRLSSTDENISAILRDRRLADRQVHLEGEFKGKDEFEVKQLYTVRNGKLYRVIYFCEVCNITAFKPSDCACCQAPTELREVPPDDPRIAVK